MTVSWSRHEAASVRHAVVVHRASAPERATRAPHALVLVPGFVQNRHAFSVPGRSLVEHLVTPTRDVYVVDLPGRGGHGASWRTDDLLAYVEHDVAEVVVDVATHHTRVGYIGHSMGGLIGAALPAPASTALQALVVIGSPLFPGDALLRRLATPVEGLFRLAHAAGRPFPGKRVARGLQTLRATFDNPRHRWPMRVWAPRALATHELNFALAHAFSDDSYAVAADLLSLARTRGERMGKIPMGDRLRALRVPLLVIGGDHDGLAPPDSVSALYDRAGSVDKTLRIVGDARNGAPIGHVDLLTGARAPEAVWAPIDAFLARVMG